MTNGVRMEEKKLQRDCSRRCSFCMLSLCALFSRTQRWYQNQYFCWFLLLRRIDDWRTRGDNVITEYVPCRIIINMMSFVPSNANRPRIDEIHWNAKFKPKCMFVAYSILVDHSSIGSSTTTHLVCGGRPMKIQMDAMEEKNTYRRQKIIAFHESSPIIIITYAIKINVAWSIFSTLPFFFFLSLSLSLPVFPITGEKRDFPVDWSFAIVFLIHASPCSLHTWQTKYKWMRTSKKPTKTCNLITLFLFGRLLLVVDRFLRSFRLTHSASEYDFSFSSGPPSE